MTHKELGNATGGKQQCNATARDRLPQGSKCAKPAKVQRDGKWFCTIHDPERIAARREKSQADWAHMYNVRAAQTDLDGAIRQGGEALEEHHRKEGVPTVLFDAARRIVKARQALAALQQTPKP